MTSIRSSDFHYLKAFIQSLVQIGTVVSGKFQFDFLYVHDLGPRSRNEEMKILTYPPRATRYAELGGPWNSEVNKRNYARQGSVLFDF